MSDEAKDVAVPAQSAPTPCSNCEHDQSSHSSSGCEICMCEYFKPIPPTSAPFKDGGYAAPTESECECGRVGNFNTGNKCVCPCHAPTESQPQQDAPITEDLKDEHGFYVHQRTAGRRRAYIDTADAIAWLERIGRAEAALTQAREALRAVQENLIKIGIPREQWSAELIAKIDAASDAALAATHPSVKTDSTNQDGEKPQE